MEKQPTISIAELSTERIEVFSTCLRNVLFSERAADTFAQVIDGKPTASGCGIPLEDLYLHNTNTTIEEVQSRNHPNEESLNLFNEFRKNMRPSDLRISTKTAQAFQNSLPSSEEFKLRLLEIVAVAVHSLAVQIYKEFHPEEERPDGPWLIPSLYHPFYLIIDNYPNGGADIVGYWAESRIFGGVVLFDHDVSQDRLLGAYINPLASAFQRPMIYQLSKTQVLDFYDLSENSLDSKEESGIPIPFSADKDAKLVGLYKAFEMNIYRESYEKRPPVPKRPHCCEPRPGMKEFILAYNKAHPRN